MIEGRRTLYAQQINSTGCDFYRVRQPVSEIMNQDLMPAALSSMVADEKDRQAWIDQCDIFLTQGAKSKQLLDYMIFCREKGIDKKFVVDYDDDIFSVSPFNPSYQYHGTEEVDIDLADGTKLRMQDGKDGFFPKENRENLITFGTVLRFADMVITPSPILSGKWKRLNKNTRVIKNFLDLDVWKPLPLLKDDKVRLVWQGGWSHFEDWGEIVDALEIVMNKFPQAELIIMGTHFPGHTKNIPADRLKIEPWVPIEAYPWKFKTLNADIGLAPLAATEFNSCKSEIKWEEYSSLEIPCVASAIPPYSLNVIDGKIGFLCSGTKEWVEVLSLLIGSAEIRKRIGKEARTHIEKNYDMKKQVHQYPELFKSLYQKELILA